MTWQAVVAVVIVAGFLVIPLIDAVRFFTGSDD